MKTLNFFSFLLIIFTLTMSCKKPWKNPEDPCNGIMNESPPSKVGIVLADKSSGNNLILSGGLTAADLKLTLSGSTTPLTNWKIINTPGSPLNGILELAVFHEKAGEYRYKIEAKGLQSVEFSYTIKQVESDNPCKIFAYPIEGLKAINWNFVPLEIGNKIHPTGIKILID